MIHSISEVVKKKNKANIVKYDQLSSPRNSFRINETTDLLVG